MAENTSTSILGDTVLKTMPRKGNSSACWNRTLKTIRKMKLERTIQEIRSLRNRSELRYKLKDFCDLLEAHLSSEERNDREEIPYFCTYPLIALYENKSTDIDIISRVLNLHLLIFQQSPVYDTARLQKYLKKDVPYTEWDKKSMEDVVLGAVVEAHYRFIHILIQLGNCPILQTEQHTLFSFIFWMEMWLYERGRKKNPGDGPTRRQIERQSMRRAHVVNKRLHEDETINQRRTALTVWTLSIFADNQGLKYDCYPEIFMQQCSGSLDCINLLLETTTEPHICYLDIKQLVDRLLRQRHCKEALLKNVCQGLKIFAPQIGESYNPRSLTHLTRCKIRDILAGGAALTEKVMQLPIPALLKEFLLFHHRHISGYREIGFELPDEIDKWEDLIRAGASYRTSVQSIERIRELFIL